MTTPQFFGRSLPHLSPFRRDYSSTTLPEPAHAANTSESQDQYYSSTTPNDRRGGVDEAEEDDLNKAIANSYKDQPQMSNPKVPSDDVSQAAPNPVPTRERIEVLMENLALRVSNELTPLDDIHGDTLIYIGPPSKSPRHTVSDHTHIKKHFHRMHQVDSTVLKALGSKKFGTGENQLLGPGCCIRAQKRFKKLDVYEKIDQDVRGGIKYHVDLRPPSEGDDAVLLLTDLTCTHGVRTWYHAKEKYEIPANLVLGTDELDTDSNPYQTSVLGGVPSDVTAAAGASSRLEADSVTNLSVSELCPLRQHSAVERMLQAIFGKDPKLDSAPKLWAFFATASFYDCAHHPSISMWIDKWLYTGKNAYFIQSNPEVTYRIGMICKLDHLVQDAYSILVGEKALLDVVSELGGSVPSSQNSIHGRELENLDDDERNRISHAASSLVRRVRKLYQSILVDTDWLSECKEYKRLINMNAEAKDEKGTIDSAAESIRQFCVSRIGHMLSRTLRMPFSDHDPSVRNTATFRNGSIRDFEIVYNNLGVAARPFTRSFWMALQRIQLTNGDYSSDTAMIAELSAHYKAGTLAGTQTINKSIVVEFALSRVNDILWDRHHRKVSEAGPKPVLPTHIEQPWSTSQLYHPGMSYSNAYNAARAGTAEEKDTTTHLGDHLSSPKRASEPTSDPIATSSGKRRKTLEHEDDGVLDQRPHLGRHELAQHLFKLGHAGLGDGKSQNAQTGDHDQDFKDLQIRLRKSDRASETTEKKGPLAGNIAGGARASETTEKKGPLAGNIAGGARASAEEDAPRKRMFPPAPPHELTVRNPDVNPGEDQQAVYVKHEDEESGMPVYRMSDAQQAAMRGDNASGSQRPFVPRGTGLAPGVTTTAQAALDIAPAYPDYGNPASPTAPKPKPKVMQQFSDVPWKENWGSSKNNSWSERYPDLARPKLFDVDTILGEMSRVLSRKCDEIVYPPHLFHGAQQTPIDLIDTLVCLDEDEWKFLPLWAGGYDDGDGGVFDEVDVPNDDAAGFKGGKRGIKSKAAPADEGSVGGSESSFDDIADEAVSTVGRASKFATDGTATVRSVHKSDTRSDDGFMNQDDVYEVVQAMSIAKMEKSKGKAASGWVPGNEFDFDHDDMPMQDDDDDGDVSTVMGAGSDVQGQFFGDDGNDEGNDKNARDDESDDSDMEIIDKDRL